MGNLRQSMTEEEWNAIGHQVEIISHPQHYGGKDNPYEAIKVIDAWGLDFALGNVVKYVSRAGKKTDSALEDLEKAKWYICHAIDKLKHGK
jgi:hypothetical protein